MKRHFFKACVAALAFQATVVGAGEAVKPAAACDQSVVAELVRGKVLDREGLASLAGIKGPSGMPFIVGGIADAAAGAMGAAAGGFLIGALMPASARLSEIDHLVLVLDKSASPTPEDAIHKMRVDTAEVTRDIMAGSELAVEELKRRFEYSLTGGPCAPGVCKILLGFLGTKSNRPVLDAQGNYVFSTTYGVYQGKTQYVRTNIERITALSKGLGMLGYRTGFWDAQNRIIYTETGEPCRPMPLPESE